MPDSPRLSRRSAVGLLGAGLTAAAASACDPGKDIAPSAGASTSPATDTATPTASADPDDALVTATLAQLGTACGALSAARTFPALRQPLASLLRAHRGHAAALGEDKVTRVPTTWPDASAALAGVRQGEKGLQAALVDAAGRAESGALARLLASAAASVAQHLAVLPRDAA